MKPQFFLHASTNPIGITDNQYQIPVPVPRQQVAPKNKAWLIEILWIDVNHESNAWIQNSTARLLMQSLFGWGQTQPLLEGPTTFAVAETGQYGSTAIGSPVTPTPQAQNWSHRVDLTDGAGNGMLLANNVMTIRTFTTTALANAGMSMFRHRVWFRFYLADLTEFVTLASTQAG